MITFPTHTSMKALYTFLEENKILITKYTVRKIYEAIKENKELASLFVVKDKPIAGFVPRENFLEVLNKSKEVLIKEEEYEAVVKTLKVIDSYYIHELIRSSQ